MIDNPACEICGISVSYDEVMASMAEFDVILCDACMKEDN